MELVVNNNNEILMTAEDKQLAYASQVAPIIEKLYANCTAALAQARSNLSSRVDSARVDTVDHAQKMINRWRNEIYQGLESGDIYPDCGSPDNPAGIHWSSRFLDLYYKESSPAFDIINNDTSIDKDARYEARLCHFAMMLLSGGNYEQQENLDFQENLDCYRMMAAVALVDVPFDDQLAEFNEEQKTLGTKIAANNVKIAILEKENGRFSSRLDELRILSTDVENRRDEAQVNPEEYLQNQIKR